MQVVSERTVTEVRNELVTVRKAVLDFGRENVVGIKLTVLSSVDRPVEVQVVEEFPGHFSMSDVQVHPGYNPEKWSISKSSRRMVFEDALTPWGEVETVYGVRIDPDNMGPLLDDPTIAEPRVASEGTDGPQDSGNTPAADGVAGEPSGAEAANAGEAPAGGRAEAEREGSEPDEPGRDDAGTQEQTAYGDTRQADAGSPSAHDPEAGVGPDGAAAEPSSETDAPETSADGSFVYVGDQAEGSETDPEVPTRGEPSAPEGGSDASVSPAGPDVVQAFVDAVSEGELSADQRAAIRDGLDLGGERHQDVQLDHLQADVAKHAAFAEEFEAFVDAVGSPAAAMEEVYTAIERLNETQAELQDQLDELTVTVDAAADDRADLRDRLDGVSDAVRTGVDEREALRTRVDELSEATRAGAEARDELRARVDDLVGEVRRLTEDRDEVEARVDELSGDVRQAVEGRGDLQARVDTLAESVQSAAADRAEIQDRLDEFATATQAVGEARSELRQHLNELLNATRVVAENLDDLRDRFDRLERDFEARREERAAGLERLDERVSEIEAIFDTEEAAALREIIAAERRWRQRHDEYRSGGAVPRSSGPGDR